METSRCFLMFRPNPSQVIADFFHIMKTINKYQDTLQDLGEYKKVWNHCPTRLRTMTSNKELQDVKTNPKEQEKTKEKDYKIPAGTGRDVGGNRVRIEGDRPGFGCGDRVSEVFLNQGDARALSKRSCL